MPLFQFPIIPFLLILNFPEFGSAGITSSFIRSVWPSSDIPLHSQEFAIPRGHNAPQQVHITQGDYDGKAVIISWVTADELGSSIVEYGTSDKYEFSSMSIVTNYTFYKYKSGYIHHCLVTDLEYATKYYYKIGKGDSSREFWFRTPPKIGPDAPITFGIIGDLGQTHNSLSTLKHYMESKGESVLFVGDLSYADRYQYNDIGIRWDSWGRLIEPIAAYQPWIWSAGNHEIEYMPAMGEIVPFKSFLHRYRTPYTASKSSNPLWYAVRRASAHIIVLSSYSPYVKYTPQWRWLIGELKRVDRKQTPWLIVLMHVPFYNSNLAHYMEGESMRAVFEKLFVRFRVDLVFAGHVHAYERSYRISNIHYNVSNGDRYPIPDRSAPVYITVGDGGNQEGLAERWGKFRSLNFGSKLIIIFRFFGFFGFWTNNRNILHFEKLVTVILHWRSRIELTHSIIGTEMMMAKKNQPIRLYSSINTGRAICTEGDTLGPEDDNCRKRFDRKLE